MNADYEQSVPGATTHDDVGSSSSSTQHRERLRTDLVVVELIRQVLRDAEAGEGIGMELGEADRAALRAVANAADRDVSIDDPEEPFDPPPYEGPAGQAHTLLVPGVYSARVLHGDEELVVLVDRSPLGSGDASAAFTSDIANAPGTERISALAQAHQVGPQEHIDKDTGQGRAGTTEQDPVKAQPKPPPLLPPRSSRRDGRGHDTPRL